MNEHFKFNPDDIIKKANENKDKLTGKKEVGGDIEKHPMDQLDILVAEINQDNKLETIKKIKSIINRHSELIEDLMENIDTQKGIANSHLKKCEEIQDKNKEARKKDASYNIDNDENLKELIKWEDRSKALVSLIKAINGQEESGDEE